MLGEEIDSVNHSDVFDAVEFECTHGSIILLFRERGCIYDIDQLASVLMCEPSEMACGGFVEGNIRQL